MNLFLLTVAVAPACGDKHSLGELSGASVTETGTGTETGTETGGGPGTGSADTGETDTATSSSGTSGGEPLCEDPSVAEVGPAVTVRLRNAGAAPIWVDHRQFCGGVFPFDLRDAQAEELNISVGLCEFTCERTLLSDCACQAGCGEPEQVIQIDPGATYERVWSGEHWPEFTIDEECTVGCELTCVARQQAPAGTYTVVARAAAAVTECEQCSCTPNVDGWCQMDGRRDGDEMVVEAELEYPAQTEILLEFQ